MKGWLDWMNWDNIHSGDNMDWMICFLSIPVIIGLALDYEIFLYSRVWEFRNGRGYNSRSSICLGLASTGQIISSAGIAMAMAFGGLILQDLPASNQIGFVLCVGVLVDTFIIRPLLVPATLSLWSTLNFWPRKVLDEELCKDIMEDPRNV